MICVNKNVHLGRQNPSLGSMTEGPTDKPEILIPMPKPGQEPSIYRVAHKNVPIFLWQ